MGLLTRALGIHAVSLEDPGTPLQPYSSLLESMGLGRSDAGVVVSEKQALRLATVYAAIKLISEDLASLPLGIYQRMPDQSVREAYEHKSYPLLHDSPAPHFTAMTMREAWIASALTWGNGYLLIVRDRAGRPLRLALLAPDKTSAIKLKDGGLAYVTTQTDSGDPAPIAPENLLHLRGTTLDGISGISPIRNCMQAMGLAIAAEKFGALFFGNGARSTGALEHPGILDEEAYGRLKASTQQWATGDQALRPIILEEGMKWSQITIAPEEAQFLETRKFQRSEIAAIYRVPLHMLQDLERSTNNNIEHQSLDYVRHTLRPWAVRIEQEANLKLLTRPFYTEHDFQDLLRGDFASQTEGFATLRAAGIYSANDIRRRLRENPIPAEEGGDIRLAPLNMMNLAQLAAGQPATPPNSQSNSEAADADTQAVFRMRIEHAYRRLIRDAIGRTTNRKGDLTGFTNAAFTPIFSSMAEAMLALADLPATTLSDQQSTEISRYAAQLAITAKSWTPQNAAEIATSLTAEAFTHLAAIIAL
jgi:HK97 family phage portal protein